MEQQVPSVGTVRDHVLDDIFQEKNYWNVNELEHEHELEDMKCTIVLWIHLLSTNA